MRNEIQVTNPEGVMTPYRTFGDAMNYLLSKGVSMEKVLELNKKFQKTKPKPFEKSVTPFKEEVEGYKIEKATKLHGQWFKIPFRS